MEKVEITKIEIAPFELKALSLLLHHWAFPAEVKKHEAILENKIPAFRKAVITGLQRRRNTAPYELINSEYLVIYPVIKWLKKYQKEKGYINKRKDQSFSYHISSISGENVVFLRPLPIPEIHFEKIRYDLCNKGMKPSEIARKLVSDRLSFMSESTSRNAISKKSHKRITLNNDQSLLASIFLDLCSVSMTSTVQEDIASILDTLYLSKVPVLFIYYLIQAANVVDKKLFIGSYDRLMIKKLCELVLPRSEKVNSHPFSELFFR